MSAEPDRGPIGVMEETGTPASQAGTGEPGDRFRDDQHLYANDLDIFGSGSLFELLSIARTRAGEDALAAWLTAPAAPQEIAARQAAIAELNERFMEASGPTDVLAFPIDDPVVAGRWPDAGTAGPDRDDPEPGDLPLLLGDVVVCPAVAQRQAPSHAGSYDDELALLVVHGVLHVLGHDHAEPAETAVMQARERELLDRFHHRR